MQGEGHGTRIEGFEIRVSRSRCDASRKMESINNRVCNIRERRDEWCIQGPSNGEQWELSLNRL